MVNFNLELSKFQRVILLENHFRMLDYYQKKELIFLIQFMITSFGNKNYKIY